MKKSELAQTLFALRPDQAKELKRFAESDWANRGSRRIHVTNLLRHLLRAFPDGEHESLAQAAVWKGLFGKAPFDKTELSKIASDALAVLRAFIVQEEHAETAEIDRLLLLAQFYHKKDLGKFFSQTAADIGKKIRSFNASGSQMHLEAFRLEALKFDHESKTTLRLDEPSLPAAVHHLDLFYLISKLRIYCIWAAQSQVGQLGTKPNNQILEDALLVEYGQLPVVSVWATAIRMFEQGGEADFLSLKNLLEEHRDSLPAGDLRELAANARLFCNRKFLHTGEQNWLNELFSLQAQHLERGYLQHESGKIFHSTLFNLILVGIKLRRFEEAEKALATVGQSIIGPDEPQRATGLYRALLAFARGRIAEALELVPSYDFEDVQHQIVCRVLWMKIWYETDALDRLESEINSFRVYIHRACEERKVITPARKEVNFAFLRFLSSLLKLKYLRPQEQVLEKTEELSGQKTVAERDWLLEKLAQLRKP